MKRVIQITKDGSSTFFIPEMGVTYHNTSGAIGESTHVFINAGLKHIIATQNLTKLSVFEIGFGTGLNTLLTWQLAKKQPIQIDYTTVELYPLNIEEAWQLNYGQQLQMLNEFAEIHQCNWEQKSILNDYFTLTKNNESVLNFSSNQKFNLIYYDAFAPNDQPELWTTAVFETLYNMLLPNGVLVTYCSKGDVKRSMQLVGFTVERLKGFANKWHMLRGTKT